MKSFDANQLKFMIAQNYGIPESQIDESLLTLYILIDSMSDESIKLLTEQKKIISESLDQIRNQQVKKGRRLFTTIQKLLFGEILDQKKYFRSLYV